MINKLLLCFFSLLLLAGLFAPLMTSQDAQFYFDRGTQTLVTADPNHEWSYRWDLNSARGDFSHAIKLNPQFTAAYTNRAGIEFTRGDFDAAWRDFTSAIGLDPQDPENYTQRARIEVAKRDLQPALDDYEKAIDLQPDYRRAYRGRMQIREMQNDFAGAVMERVRMIEETGPAFINFSPTSGGFSGPDPGFWRDRLSEQLDRALGSDTNFAWGYYYQGVLKSLTNDWDGASADFQRCQGFSDGRLKDYAAIQIWLVQTRTGEGEKADQVLLAYCRNRTTGTPADWQMAIAKFLLNESSEADFSKAINSTDTGRQQSEFWYYTGMKHLLASDKVGASDCFQKSLATKPRSCVAFLSARAELSSLNTATPAE